MKKSARLVLYAVAVLLPVQAAVTLAENIVLNIKVVNPSSEPQMKSIVQPLPAGLSSNDIISLDGMELVYDSTKNAYSVRVEQELGPGKSESFEVSVKDVWNIPPGELDVLERHAKRLFLMLKNTVHAGRGEQLKAAITNTLDCIAKSQADNKVRRVGPDEHIAAFARDSRLLDGTRRLVAEMEDIVAGTGQDTLRSDPAPEDREALRLVGETRRKTIIFRVAKVNLSTNSLKVIDIVEYLPPAVTLEDVIDAGGLQVRYDPAKGACCVSKEGVEIKPGKSVTYEMLIEDRWKVSGVRMEMLRTRLIAACGRCMEVKKYKSLESDLGQLAMAFKAIAAATTPEILDDTYIQFHGEQTRRIGVIENYLAEVERAMTDKGPPPPAKYAWLSIYSIAIFLSIFSVAVFWRVRRKPPQ